MFGVLCRYLSGFITILVRRSQHAYISPALSVHAALIPSHLRATMSQYPSPATLEGFETTNHRSQLDESSRSPAPISWSARLRFGSPACLGVRAI